MTKAEIIARIEEKTRQKVNSIYVLEGDTYIFNTKINSKFVYLYTFSENEEEIFEIHYTEEHAKAQDSTPWLRELYWGA